jgi:hypothetical protein
MPVRRFAWTRVGGYDVVDPGQDAPCDDDRLDFELERRRTLGAFADGTRTASSYAGASSRSLMAWVGCAVGTWRLRSH